MKFDELYNKLTVEQSQPVEEGWLARTLGPAVVGASTLFGSAEDAEAKNKPAITKSTQEIKPINQKFAPSDKLINTLIQIESSGDDKDVGDSGKAYGCLQIHKEYVDDVNKNYNTTYTHKDAFDRKKAIDITKRYLAHYGAYYYKLTGQMPTAEVFAKMHNGGPKGWKERIVLPDDTEKIKIAKQRFNQNILAYWTKVQNALGKAA